MHRISQFGTAALAAGVALVFAPAASAATQQSGTAQPATPAAQTAAAAPDASQPEAIHDHIEEAEDLVEALLDWQHAPTASGDAARGTWAPQPATTLIAVDRERVQKLAAAIDAIAVMMPPSPAGRGDLAAHARKAQEIARELMPSAGTDAVGTTGAATGAAAPATTADRSANRAAAGSGVVTLDRTALERLELEIDAMDRLSARALGR
jgi:hypothetical protein